MKQKTNKSAKKDLVTAEKTSQLPSGYKEFITDLKVRIRSAQLKAAVKVNTELVVLYWDIGCDIVTRQQNEGWGANIVGRISKDLHGEFPGVSGFSPANIYGMRALYLAFVNFQQPVGKLQNGLPEILARIPWGHNMVLLNKLEDNIERLWYAQKTIEHGWSRTMLETWIESNLYARQGKAPNNFKQTLPKLQSDLAQQTLKNPYNFEFLNLKDEVQEQKLEQGLTDNIQKFLTELGHGFAFVGRQYQIEVDDKPWYIDLLFYNFKLHCFVVVELKTGEFHPRDAGQLSFYISAIDKMVRNRKVDQPTIGIIICKSKGKFTVEYALDNLKRPVGIASYEAGVLKSLPQDLREVLPTGDELTQELGDIEDTEPKSSERPKTKRK